MLFLLIQLFVIVFSGKVFALSFKNPCTTTCGFPGLICVAGQCLCDWKLNLFWTGARCLACPEGWMLTESKCVNYYGTKLSWEKAAATCQQNKADLISFRDKSTFALVYQATTNIYRRKKRVDISVDKTVGWTSARAIQFDGLGLYRWSDNSLGTFNSQSSWWCRQGNPGFVAYYQFNEPTRYFYNNVGESCILFRRGTTSIAALCLDDVLCDGEYPFICERSESTAQKYFGPPPSSGGTSNSVGSTSTTGNGASTENMNSNTQNNHHGAIAPDPLESKSKKKSKTTIIAVIIFLLLLLVGVLIGIFFFIKRRNARRTQFHVDTSHKKENPTPINAQPPAEIDTKANDISDVDEIAIQPIESDDMGLTLNTDMNPGNIGLNIGNQKQQKNKRGGYSKQQFENEFE